MAFVVLFVLANGTPQAIRDTPTLVQGARVAVDCVSAGDLHGCGHVDGTRFTRVGPYPLLQYLPTVVLIKLGRTDDQIVHDLAWLSSIAFVASLVLVYAIGQRAARRGWSPLLLVVMLTGPLIWYSRNSFGEMLAVAITLLFMTAVVRRAPPVFVALSLALAATTKETAIPFLLVLGFVCARETGDRWFPARHWTIALLVGAATGMALNLGFNLFRFGEVANTAYLEPAFKTPGVELKARLFVSLWVSPNGGLLWFWMSACLVLAAAGIVMVVQLAQARAELNRWLPTAVVLALVVVNTIGLASWFAPFGWLAWGPRLSLPLTPAFVIGAAVAGGDVLADFVARILRSIVGFAVVVLVLIVFALPQLGVLWNPSSEAALYTPDDACPVPAVVQENPNYYYGCIQHGAWRTDALILWDATESGPLSARAAQLATAVAVVALMLLARRSMVASGVPAKPSAATAFD